jgi:hypothetical protein
MDQDIPYRTPFQTSTPAASVSSTDENEYSTLLKQRTDFAEALAELRQFDAFDLTGTELQVKQQIVAHRIAFDILSPIFESLNSAVNDINAKYREK